ncbi:MAG: hypothetical protein LBM75_03480 [Myxococcales bacterium]|jgi:hypothetical protein|nr:hypothetical protein [Myxococcales bacterium]
MENFETFSAAASLSPVFDFWKALSQLFQMWVLTPDAFQSLQSKLSLPLAVGFLGFGLFATIFGGRSIIPYRIVAALPGLVMGWYVGAYLSLIVGLPARPVTYGLALGLAVLGVAKPQILTSLGFALIGGIFTYEIVIPDQLGALASNELLAKAGIIFGGALFLGFVTFLVERITTAIACSGVGAICAVLGLTALLRLFDINAAFVQSPYFLQICLAAVFVLGLFIQYRYISTEAQRQAERVESAREKMRQKEERDRNKRFEAYGKKAAGK